MRLKIIIPVCAILLLSQLYPSCSSGGSNANKNNTGGSDGAEDTGKIGDTGTPLESITQYGITWTFDKEYVCGQFANGDYWVTGPVTVAGISPETTEVSGRVMNGSMVNPAPGSQQGYDSAIEGTYSSSLNAATGISESTPLVLNAGSSLVSSISQADSIAGNRAQLKTAAVLTVLSTIPASGSFRPPYCGTDKSVNRNISQLDYSLLESLEPVSNTPELADIERNFERVWLDHIGGWVGRALHPIDNMPDYGTIIAGEVSDGALMLHLDFTNEQKKTLLVRYVQLGIDNFGIIQSGGEDLWEPDGGHCAGRKWPILFAGMMLNDGGMKAIGQKSGDYLYTYDYPAYGPGNVPPDYIHFQEDGQTFYVMQADVDLEHYYPPDTDDLAEYSVSDIDMPEWGIRHSTNPSWDGNEWECTYRAINAYAWAGFVLSARMMNANIPQLWNNPALFDYEDRHMAVTAASTLAPDWRYSVDYWGVWASQEGSWRTTSKFMENMWDEYRDIY